MIRAIHKRLEEKEEGFTLIELLVVVIIIGILAAIAIPVFMNQRQRAFRAAVQSDLRNAAVEMETWFTDNNTYVAATAGDQIADYSATTDVDVTVEAASGNTYCLEGTHANTDFGEVWSITPGGGLTEAACTTPTP